MIKFTYGDMFEVPVDIRVNTVNCVGVMGKGVALAFKNKYPEMFKDYKKKCADGRIRPGSIDVWKDLMGDWIINFPTKDHWRQKSKYEDIEEGLKSLRDYLLQAGEVRVALPALGCGHGGLDWNVVSKMIGDYLGGLKAEILVFEPADSRNIGNKYKNDALQNEQSNAPIDGVLSLRKEDNLFPDILKDSLIDKIFIKGSLGVLQNGILSFYISERPYEREIAAIESCMRSLNNYKVSLSLPYSPYVADKLLPVINDLQLSCLFWVSGGLRNKDIDTRLIKLKHRNSLAFISIESSPASFGRGRFTEARRKSWVFSQACVVTDPAPEEIAECLTSYRKSSIPQLYFIDYGASNISTDFLVKSGAKSLKRNAASGLPNMDSIVEVFEVNRTPSKI